jgi:hypothetical protein
MASLGTNFFSNFFIFLKVILIFYKLFLCLLLAFNFRTLVKQCIRIPHWSTPEVISIVCSEYIVFYISIQCLTINHEDSNSALLLMYCSWRSTTSDCHVHRESRASNLNKSKVHRTARQTKQPCRPISNRSQTTVTTEYRTILPGSSAMHHIITQIVTSAISH